MCEKVVQDYLLGCGWEWHFLLDVVEGVNENAVTLEVTP